MTPSAGRNRGRKRAVDRGPSLDGQRSTPLAKSAAAVVAVVAVAGTAVAAAAAVGGAGGVRRLNSSARTTKGRWSESSSGLFILQFA